MNHNLRFFLGSNLETMLTWIGRTASRSSSIMPFSFYIAASKSMPLKMSLKLSVPCFLPGFSSPNLGRPGDR